MITAENADRVYLCFEDMMTAICEEHPKCIGCPMAGDEDAAICLRTAYLNVKHNFYSEVIGEIKASLEEVRDDIIAAFHSRGIEILIDITGRVYLIGCPEV